MTYCWLVELFEPGGNSMGQYHTGFTEFLPFESRTTRDPNKARRFESRADALMVCVRLLHMRGVWRAVEHGFDGSKMPSKPLRRNIDGVCTRSTCECEREGLGDECIWLRPAEAQFECLGEPSLCDNPRGCACVPDSKTPNVLYPDSAK